MVLSLRIMATGNLPVQCKPGIKAKSVLENISHECSEKLEKLELDRHDLKIEYSDINRKYYDVLLGENMAADVYTCVNEMSMKHNTLIEYRNQMALMKLWSNNYVILDLAISKYIAWPSATADRQELLTLFYGILSHHKEIELSDPTESEQLLLSIIDHYVSRCKHWYNIFNKDTDLEIMCEISRKMFEIHEKIKKIEIECELMRNIINKIHHIFEYNDISDLWGDLIDLIPSLTVEDF